MTQEKIQIELIRSVMLKKNYVFFEKGSYNLNIVGIRSNSREANTFNDFICVIFKDKLGNDIIRSWRATTDAGTYWLKNPMNAKGTAILVPNQYRKGWRLGLHKGQYKALVQNKPLKVYRDNNKDNILDFNDAIIDEGMFGIDIHRSNPTYTSVAVEKWSAGCQVFANPKDFDDFLQICETASTLWGDEFTYTLLNESDFGL